MRAFTPILARINGQNWFVLTPLTHGGARLGLEPDEKLRGLMNRFFLPPSPRRYTTLTTNFYVPIRRSQPSDIPFINRILVKECRRRGRIILGLQLSRVVCAERTLESVTRLVLLAYFRDDPAGFTPDSARVRFWIQAAYCPV